jgi:uncharacterized protein YjiS (DUF1127 family)
LSKQTVLHLQIIAQQFAAIPEASGVQEKGSRKMLHEHFQNGDVALTEIRESLVRSPVRLILGFRFLRNGTRRLARSGANVLRGVLRRRILSRLSDRQLRDAGICPSEAGRRRRSAVEPNPNLEGLR